MDTLSKHVIESGLLDSDEYDVPNTGTDVDRAKALIGFFLLEEGLRVRRHQSRQSRCSHSR